MSDVLIAPFTNSQIRDWPTGHYVRLIGLLLGELATDVRIRVIGTPGQRLGACDIVRSYASDRVSNDCGQTGWTGLRNAIASARCVIGNNSGITHLSSLLGAPTVCVFGGSHDRREWRPRGGNVVLLTRAIGCSPCQLDHGEASHYDKACLREIEPAAVMRAALQVMIQGGAAALRKGDEI